MGSLAVFFDYAKVNDTVIIGVSSYENERSLKCAFKGVKNLNKLETQYYNQFHNSIKALEYALLEVEKWISDNKIEELELTLLNQNSLIFKWLEEQSYSYEYEELFEGIYDIISRIIDSTKFKYKIIKGKDNKAKKLLKNESCNYKCEASEIDFSSLGKRFEKKSTPKQEKEKLDNLYVLRANEF